MTDYKVDIKTVDERYAGTDSQVAIKLWSEDVVSKVATLDNWGNDFEPGAVDSYTVQADLDGPVTAVELFLDGNDQWHPEWVKVTDPTSKLVWRAFFQDTVMGRGSAKKPAVLIDVDGKYRSPDTGDDAAQKSLLATYVEGLKEMVQKSGGAPNLIATGLVQFLERAGFKPIRFVSIGAGVGGTVIGTTALEGGAVHTVNGSALGRKVGDYFTITSGWEVGVGVDGGGGDERPGSVVGAHPGEGGHALQYGGRVDLGEAPHVGGIAIAGEQDDGFRRERFFA